MIELGWSRRGVSDRHPRAASGWVARLEALEPRVALTNGLVGVPGQFSPPTHEVNITSVPEDPDNNGVVSSPNLTIVGAIQRPGRQSFTDTHSIITIDALENGDVIGTVTWNTSSPGPPELHQDPTAPFRALLALPITLQSTTSDPQNVTFRVTVAGFGTLPWNRVDNGQPLTGQFVVVQPPTVAALSPVSSPRTEPVQSVDATFSKAINPTTFTTADLTLTRDGKDVPLGAGVTITSSNDTLFTIAGLAAETTALGAYVLTVSAEGVQDSAGVAGTGSQSVSFTVESANAPPRIARVSPITTPRIEPIEALGVTFTKPIDPATFTTVDVTLTREGVTVPLGSDVTITTTDGTTFSIGNLTAYTTPPGAYAFTINAAGVMDLTGNPGTGSETITFTVEPPVLVTGPRIEGLVRFGTHGPLSILMLTFDRPLDPARAVLRNNYLVFGPGRDGRIGTVDDNRIPLSSGYYNSANRTVTLVMARKLSLSKFYRIVVRGTGPKGLTDVNGVALDGQSTGNPGTDFTTTFGREILVVTAPPRSTASPSANAVQASGGGRYRHFQVGQASTTS